MTISKKTNYNTPITNYIDDNNNYISAGILLICCYFIGLTLSIGIILSYVGKQTNNKLVCIISIIMINIWLYGIVTTFVMIVVLCIYICIIWHRTIKLAVKSLKYTYVKYKSDLKKCDKNISMKKKYIQFCNIIEKIYYFFRDIIKWIRLHPDIKLINESTIAKQIKKIIVDGINTINYLINIAIVKLFGNNNYNDKYLYNTSGKTLAKKFINIFFDDHKNHNI